MHIKRIFGRLKDQFNSSLEAFTDSGSNSAPEQSVERLSETRPAPPPAGAYANPPSPPPLSRPPAPEPGSNPLRGVVTSTPENSVYQQRSEQVQRIEAMFGGYGNRVSSYILTQSFTEGGVRRIVEKLSLSSRGRDGADLGQICQWIETHGIEEFCKRTNLRLTAPPPVPAPPDPSASSSGESKVNVRPLDLKARQAGSSDSDSNRERMATGPRPRQMSPGETQPVNFEGSRQKVTVQPVGLDGKEVDRLRRPSAQPASPAQSRATAKPEDLIPPRAASPVPDSDPRMPQRSSAEVYLNQFLDEESSHKLPAIEDKKKP